MLWNNFADLNITMKNCRGVYEDDSHNVMSTIRNHCLHKLSFPFCSSKSIARKEKRKNYWMSKSTGAQKVKQRLHCYIYNQTKFNYEKWFISNDKYASNSKEQPGFVIAITVVIFTPLSLVEHKALINLILKRDPRLNMISRTRLSRNLITRKTTELAKNVHHVLTHIPAVSLSYDL
jgi:hypothetical protein